MNNSERQKLKKKEFEEYIDKIEGYELLTEYETAKKSITIRHNECGKVYETTPFHFKNRKQRCRKCNDYNMKKSKNFQEKFFDLLKKENYTLLSKYTSSKHYVTLKHEKCGKVYEVEPENFIADRRCPSCYSSKGEIKVRKYLKEKSIDFTEQYRIEDCKYNRPLPFDFAVFKNGELEYLIEYNGIQHYKPVEFFGGIDNLEEILFRDNIKQRYCYYNNIELIEIPYWKDDKYIREIIKNL